MHILAELAKAEGIINFYFAKPKSFFSSRRLNDLSESWQCVGQYCRVTPSPAESQCSGLWLSQKLHHRSKSETAFEFFLLANYDDETTKFQSSKEMDFRFLFGYPILHK